MKRTLLPLVIGFLCVLPVASAQDTVEKARGLLEAGRADEALTLLQEHYSALKGNADAVRLMTDCALQASDFQAAVDYGMKLVDLEPKNAEAHLLAAKANYLRAEAAKTEPGSSSAKVEGFFGDALSFCNSGVALAPKHPELLSYRAHSLFWLSRLPESAAAFEAAQAVTEGADASNLFYAARSHRIAGDLDKALAAVARAVQIQPDASWIHVQHGECLVAAKRWDDSVAAFGKALEVGGSVDDEAKGIVATIVQSYGQEHLGPGLSACELWAKAHPKSALAHLYVGWYKTKLGRDADAVKDFAKSFAVSGNTQAGAAVEAAHALTRQGQLKEAAEWLVTAQNTPWDWGSDPNQQPARLILPLANQLAGAGRYGDAIELLEKHALKARPNDWMILNNAGLYLRDWGERARDRSRELSDRSRKTYLAAVERVLEDESATGTERAMVLNDTGLLFGFKRYHAFDLEKAVGYYRRALSQDPSYVDALENLGLAQNELGNFAEAKTLFEKVLAQQPGRPVSMGGLAAAKRGLAGQ